MSFRPFYLPREFGQITDILVYVPGPDFENGGRENNREFQRGGFEVVVVVVELMLNVLRCHLTY